MFRVPVSKAGRTLQWPKPGSWGQSCMPLIMPDPAEGCWTHPTGIPDWLLKTTSTLYCQPQAGGRASTQSLLPISAPSPTAGFSKGCGWEQGNVHLVGQGFAWHGGGGWYHLCEGFSISCSSVSQAGKTPVLPLCQLLAYLRGGGGERTLGSGTAGQCWAGDLFPPHLSERLVAGELVGLSLSQPDSLGCGQVVKPLLWGLPSPNTMHIPAGALVAGRGGGKSYPSPCLSERLVAGEGTGLGLSQLKSSLGWRRKPPLGKDFPLALCRPRSSGEEFVPLCPHPAGLTDAGLGEEAILPLLCDN